MVNHYHLDLLGVTIYEVFNFQLNALRRLKILLSEGNLY